MASILKKVGQATNVPTNYYEVDDVADMNAIDTTYVIMGSRCYVINEGKVFALNSNKEWKEVPMGGGGGDLPDDVIYDGGVITPTSSSSSTTTEPGASDDDVIYDGGTIRP